MNRKRIILAAAVLGASVATIAAVGGGSSVTVQQPTPPTGGFGTGAPDTVISGVVTCDGKPLTTGAVYFIGPKGLAGQGVITGDGRYQAGLVPEGPVRVVYCSRPLTDRQVQVQLGNPDPGPSGDWVDQPPPSGEVFQRALAAEGKYGPTKPGLSYTVVRGPQTFDVVLSTGK